MKILIKEANDIVLCNGRQSICTKVTYDDYIVGESHEERGTISTVDCLQHVINLRTKLSNNFYKPNTKLLIKRQYDLSDNFYEVLDVSQVECGDYLVHIEKEFVNSFSETLTLDIHKYLHNGVYDISLVYKDLCDEIGVSKQFLLNALRSGVPDNQVYNGRLNTYLSKHGYLNEAALKQDLFSKNCKAMKKKIPIDEGLVVLIFLYLLGDYTLDEGVVTFKTERLEAEIPFLIRFLQKHKIKFDVSGSFITCNSTFLYGFFKDDLEDLIFLRDFPQKFEKMLLNFILKQKFVTGSKEALWNFKLYLGLRKIYTTLEVFSDDLFTLSVLAPDDYISLDKSYTLIPITSVENITDTTFYQFNIF